ncbi:hypothetical protein MYP_114 [Sporocytophaga myxococcoides]|uniref:Uncharacterized protein n=1 Tax=Sporocytophaga myxococcoides TaxID=153721 RepID=A0A098L9R7_9BACT|nr:hypothetical protein MYP_114 [Sporocytophaga myxococcoides]
MASFASQQEPAGTMLIDLFISLVGYSVCDDFNSKTPFIKKGLIFNISVTNIF